MKNFKKQIFLTVFLILTSASLAFAQAAGGTPRTIDLAAQVTEFEVNGLKILVKRRPSAPTVAAGLFIRGGVRNITDKNAGIENMMLDVATEAGKNFPREIVRREQARTGGSIGATTGNDYSVISLASTRKDFDRLWEIFTDVTLNPAFNEQDIARVREQILTGLRESETSPDGSLNALRDRIVYAGHPYSNESDGTIETVSKFTTADLLEYHKKVMQTSQLLLVFVGDLDAEDLKKRIADSFGKLPKGNYKEASLPTLDFSKPTLDVVSRTIPTNYVRGVFDAPGLDNPDYYAMRVAMSILGSRIFREVRVNRQLSYAPDADMEKFGTNTGSIYVTAVDANQAVSVMLDEIQKLKSQPISQDQLDAIAGYFLTTYYLGQETNAAQAGELARYELIGGGWKNSFQFLEKIREVRARDIRNVAEKYMKNIRFVVVGNPAAINRTIFLQQKKSDIGL
jgi:zinc protease